jgi:hypothetical protein
VTSAPHPPVPNLDSFCLGYAGPRRLGSGEADDARWERQLGGAVAAAARGIRARLAAHRPLCLVGALARGADLAIAEAFLDQGAVLRAWLPEPLDRFANEADFPDPRARERLAALVLRPEVAEVRSVSSAPDRRERFAECAALIVRESDALLCVRHWDQVRLRGGTEETVALAAALGRPIVEVRLDPDPSADAELRFPSAWTSRDDAGPLPFPRLDPRSIVLGWKETASSEAGRSKHWIVRAAAWTVGLQLGAAGFAVLTFGQPAWELPSLVVKTSVMLCVTGLAIWSARRAVTRRWARLRFAAELHRSWSAVRGLQGAATWFEEDLPAEFALHGRDLALLHGLDRSADPGSARPASAAAESSLSRFRDRYRSERIASQRSYAEATARSAGRRKQLLSRLFHASLAATLAALFTRLGLRATESVAAWADLDRVCSLVSILGPTLGAAAVSFIALLDLPARRETQARLAEFLSSQEALLATCTDWMATRHAVVATERRLLGEIKDWYARHAFRK